MQTCLWKCVLACMSKPSARAHLSSFHARVRIELVELRCVRIINDRRYPHRNTRAHLRTCALTSSTAARRCRSTSPCRSAPSRRPSCPPGSCPCSPRCAPVALCVVARNRGSVGGRASGWLLDDNDGGGDGDGGFFFVVVVMVVVR